jgi:hypothetical protein
MKVAIAWILLAPALLICAGVLFFGLLHIVERFEPPDRVIVGIVTSGIVGYLMLLSAWRKEDREAGN